MKETGGYFELELNHGKEYHKDALRLNLGRTAFEYLLKAREIKKIYLPSYICEVLVRSVKNAGIDLNFYQINRKLEPVFDFMLLKPEEYFLYINYFGLKDSVIHSMAADVSNLIIDNAQAFFSIPERGVDTFYSPRKFLGVPDGAYLYTDKWGIHELEQDYSEARFSHLIGRIDNNAAKYYEVFRENESGFDGQAIKWMSRITRRLLDSIDYQQIRKRRVENFLFLHKTLSKVNELEIFPDRNAVPMIYPFMTRNGSELKRRLIDNKVFVATYWPGIKENTASDSFTGRLADDLVALPVDQRYTTEDMSRIIDLI